MRGDGDSSTMSTTPLVAPSSGLHGGRSHGRVVFQASSWLGKFLCAQCSQMLTAVAEPVAQPHVLRARPVVPARDMEASLDFLRGGFSCGSAADHISKRRRIDDQPGDGLHVTTFGMHVVEEKAVECLVERVRVFFAAKPASTLDKRLCSLRLYHTWCVSSCLSPLPVEEETVYKYFLHCSDTTATRGATFRSGLAFVGGYFGLPSVEQVLSSRRCQGAMKRQRCRQRLQQLTRVSSSKRRLLKQVTYGTVAFRCSLRGVCMRG